MIIDLLDEVICELIDLQNVNPKLIRDELLEKLAKIEAEVYRLNTQLLIYQCKEESDDK